MSHSITTKRKEGGNALHLPPSQSHLSSSEIFSKQLLRQSIAQTLVSSGIEVAESSALEALVEACKRKVVSLGIDLKHTCERSSRKNVTVEDFLQVVPVSTGLTHQHTTVLKEDMEALSCFVGVPNFPVVLPAPPANSLSNGSNNNTSSKEIASCGIPHLPPFPPAHTYKRLRALDGQDGVNAASNAVETTTVNELRRIQQRHSTLVRESLAKMQREEGV